MVWTEAELDAIVYDILLDCRSVTPPLERNEIVQHVVNHLAPQIHKQVCAALTRLISRGLVCDDSGSAEVRPARYRLAACKTQN
jgi:hypothetical protein